MKSTQKRKRKRSRAGAPVPAPRPSARSRLLWIAGGAVLAAGAVIMAVILLRAPAAPEIPAFDGEAAYGHLQRQCDFGPRVPGTPAHDSCRAFLVAELRRHADNVVQQSFTHTVARTGESVTLTNIIAGFGLQAHRRVLLAAHWDTRPWADQDPDSTQRHLPILGANDGASGVAVLLEVARVLKAHPPAVGVDLILFDGEDLGTPGEMNTYALGAQHFSRTKDPRYNPLFALVVDMVGDRDLQIYPEVNSMRYASGIVNQIWGLASRLGVKEFLPGVRHEVYDDHLPLITAGIPAVDLIDFDYPYWHTLADTPDKCSAASLEKVGRVLLATLYHGTGA